MKHHDGISTLSIRALMAERLDSGKVVSSISGSFGLCLKSVKDGDGSGLGHDILFPNSV